MTTIIDESCVREYPIGVSAKNDYSEDEGEQLQREVARLRELKIELIRKDNLALQARIEVLQRRIKKPSLLKYLPAGEFVFRPSDPPVIVTEKVAAMIEGTRMGIVATGAVPYFGFNHNDGPASFYPGEFFWKDGVDGGVYAAGIWTSAGRAAVVTGQYQYFSPTWYFDVTRGSRPITCMYRALPNMGGICNHPKFGATMKLNPDLVR